LGGLMHAQLVRCVAIWSLLAKLERKINLSGGTT
jgi:hypothetical protein